MARKLTYNELEQTVNELEKVLHECKVEKEIALRAKEQLERTFNAVPDHIATIDSHYRILRVNRSLADKLECTQEELRGERCYQYICKADHPPSSCPHAQMLSDGKVHTSEIYSKQLGMNLLVTSSPLNDDEGRLFGGVHIARNIKMYRETEKI